MGIAGEVGAFDLPHFTVSGRVSFSPRQSVCYARRLMPDPNSERRSQQRIPVRLGVSIRSAQNQSATGYTRDLNTGGIFLYADSEILVGSELEMVLMLPPQLTDGEKRWVCCQASVIRVEPGGEDGRFGIAASIRNIATLPEISG
jgi:PilZ domain